MRPLHVRTPFLPVLLAAAFTALAGFGPVHAQGTGTMRGQVTDAATGRPLAGAQIALVGTGRGALANQSGQFLIVNVPAGQQTVRVEMIGYGTEQQQVDVGVGETLVLDFALSQKAIALDEIVVTGVAGQASRRSLGNSVSQIQAEQLTDLASVTNVQELLTARAPGLTLMANAGEVGASSKIRIRGAGSLEAGLEPVFYVDGVRVESGQMPNLDSSWGGSQSANPLDYLNPSDIESIEVIKGPAAATLYGAEAAGGVVQIITKKGRAGVQGIQWTASTEYGRTNWQLEMPTNYWLCRDEHINNPAIYPGCSGLSVDQPLSERLLSDQPVRRHPAALREGDLWNHAISARGGGESYNYYLSLQSLDEQGVFHNNYNRRTSGRANFGLFPYDNLNLQVNVGYGRTHVRMPWNNNSSNGILRNGFRGRAGALDDPWAEGFRGLGPEQSNLYNNQTYTERTTIGVTANYSPWRWFQNKITVGMDKQDRLNEIFWPIDTTGRCPLGSSVCNGAVERWLPQTHLWTVDYAGTLSFDFAQDYTSNFSGGMQLNARAYEWDYLYGEGLVADKLRLVSAAARTEASQGKQEQTSLGFYVQEQVGWKNRLFATAAVRIDDNSAFGRDFSLVVYPKASLSWVISEEPFFDVGWVDELKLRGAWGQAGNAPAPFTADRTFSVSTTTLAGRDVNYLEFSEFGNPDLKAETGQEIELGFESSLFAGRVGVDFTYYYQQTKDALIRVPDPPSTGFSGSHLTNIGEVKNSGIEIFLNASPIHTRDVEWDVTASIATNDNELVSFGGTRDEIAFGAFASVQRHREGYPLGGFWAVDVERDASGTPILDENGNAIVNLDGCRWAPSDPTWSPGDCNEIFMGPMLPTREIGLSNSLTFFGNVTLFGSLDYKGGHSQWCAMCSIRSRIDRNAFPVNDPNATDAERAAWLSRQTLTHIRPADFLKLRELSLTYRLPGEWISRFGADNATVTLAGRNLWMWTRYDTEMADPEVTFYSTSDFTHLDYASMPMLRRLAVSMRVNF